MKTKKAFSIIELMTVILIILLLLSLTIPIFINLKMNARNTICKGQLRQISILFNSYAVDNNGYFPNDLKTDINITSTSNNEFYYGWNGHLLPYMDHGLKSFNRGAKLISDGNVYAYVPGIYAGVNPPDELIGGWAVINDACYKGGFNDLKTFICPEIHANTYDVGISTAFNGLKIPRISQMSESFSYVGVDRFYIGGGIPTTYLANDKFFGFDAPYRPKLDGMRIDEITSISQKVLLTEGGLACDKGTNGEPRYIYYRVSAGDLGVNGPTNYEGIKKYNTSRQRISYVHDTQGPFWIANLIESQWFPAYSFTWDQKYEYATKFNIAFEGKAYMFQGKHGYAIVSYIDPAEKPFDNFFKANDPKMAVMPFQLFDEPEFHYLTGSMNILYGDSSVSTKDQSWISMNRAKFSSITSE